jgi:predicted AAA+ superfamily ATPase
MTLFETGHSNGSISLKNLLNGVSSQCKDPGLTLDNIIECISSGGWPLNLGLNSSKSIQSVRDYLEEIRRVDIRQVNHIKHDPEKVGRFLRSLARNISTSATATTLAADSGGSDGPINDDTVREYIDALTRLMIVEDQPAWAPHLRSKLRLRKSPKRHFVDPSLAVAALRATPDTLMKDLNFLGLLFESLVIRDLRVFAQANDAQVFHYRDETNFEVDAIVEAANGQWAAFEIKLGSGRIDEGANNLLKFINKIDIKKTGNPATLGVIVGQGFGYTREDGVSVIPIGSLGP